MDAAELTTVPEMLGQLLEKHGPEATSTKCLEVQSNSSSGSTIW